RGPGAHRSMDDGLRGEDPAARDSPRGGHHRRALIGSLRPPLDPPGNFRGSPRSKEPSGEIRHRTQEDYAMRRSLVAVLLTVAVLSPEGPAAATPPLAITRESQKDLMVTIYNGNLGLVKDTREAHLPAGMSEVQFADVAAQIDPTSVHLKSLTDPAGLRILEQNYEYDLLSSQ